MELRYLLTKADEELVLKVTISDGVRQKLFLYVLTDDLKHKTDLASPFF